MSTRALLVVVLCVVGAVALSVRWYLDGESGGARLAGDRPAADPAERARAGAASLGASFGALPVLDEVSGGAASAPAHESPASGAASDATAGPCTQVSPSGA